MSLAEAKIAEWDQIKKDCLDVVQQAYRDFLPWSKLQHTSEQCDYIMGQKPTLENPTFNWNAIQKRMKQFQTMAQNGRTLSNMEEFYISEEAAPAEYRRSSMDGTPYNKIRRPIWSWYVPNYVGQNKYWQEGGKKRVARRKRSRSTRRSRGSRLSRKRY